jgi:hypothetical protein
MGEEEETKEEVKKKERKIYKGKVFTASALEKELKEKGILPVQPMLRRPKGAPEWLKLPPTFMATKFSPGYSKESLILHYYDPAKKMKAQMEVPGDFELNVLEGTRGVELSVVFEDIKKTALQTFVQRIQCTVGTDPEIFAVDKKGEVLPAWTYLGGKDSPTAYDYAGFAGQCYWDGFQAEFNTPPNLTCLENMSSAVRGGLHRIWERAGKKGGKLSHKSVLEVSEQVLGSCKPEHVAFGCSPSKNVYGLKGNIKDGRDVKYRFAGGHIHLGLTDKREERLQTIVKGLDTVLGVACVSLYASYDNPIRRQYYGQPGEYRTPPHGLEYRVLSNAWLMHPLIYNLTFDLARAVAGLADDGFISAWNAKEDETVETIMNHDVERARDILKRNDSLFTSVLQMGGGGYSTQPGPAKKVWNEGLESAINKPEDIVGNWGLENESKWLSATRSYYQAWNPLSRGAKV